MSNVCTFSEARMGFKLRWRKRRRREGRNDKGIVSFIILLLLVILSLYLCSTLCFGCVVCVCFFIMGFQRKNRFFSSLFCFQKLFSNSLQTEDNQNYQFYLNSNKITICFSVQSNVFIISRSRWIEFEVLMLQTHLLTIRP